MSATHAAVAILVDEVSLYEQAHAEALRHKWIESQKHGRDLGEWAIRDWYRRYWRTYCRFCRVEHIEGNRRWREFGNDDFGHLYSLIVAGDLLVDRILDRIYTGWENLDIINWAMTWALPMDRVVDILIQIDVNRARLDYPV
jgi:hypothetical protein